MSEVSLVNGDHAPPLLLPLGGNVPIECTQAECCGLCERGRGFVQGSLPPRNSRIPGQQGIRSPESKRGDGHRKSYIPPQRFTLQLLLLLRERGREGAKAKDGKNTEREREKEKERERARQRQRERVTETEKDREGGGGGMLLLLVYFQARVVSWFLMRKSFIIFRDI